MPTFILPSVLVRFTLFYRRYPPGLFEGFTLDGSGGQVRMGF